MTLRFIVARILRELIELAERDADAELVDALHDALDVASPAGRLEQRSGDIVDRGDVHDVTRGPGPGRRRLGTFRRSRTAGGGGPGPRALLGRMPERRWRVLGRGRGLFAI